MLFRGKPSGGTKIIEISENCLAFSGVDRILNNPLSKKLTLYAVSINIDLCIYCFIDLFKYSNRQSACKVIRDQFLSEGKNRSDSGVGKGA
jgi:hypothetical protein